MGSNPPANTPPPKPWERAGSSSGPVPFKPPSSGNTSAVVEASGTAKPGEVVTTANRNPTANTNTLGRPLPTRPWEQQQSYGNSNTYGGYGSNLGYNSSYGSGMYGANGGYGGTSSYGGGGLYGNSMYRGGYGGGGGMYGGSGMYGGGMYNGGIGGQMGGGYGMGMGMGMGGPFGNQDPNNPPPSPPGIWMSFLHMMHGVVNVFGRISVLIDQNTQAFHLFMSAMLQFFDRSGMLYGELARFVLRILGIRSKARKLQPGPGEVQGPNGQGQYSLEGPKAPTASWDNVWGRDGGNGAN